MGATRNEAASRGVTCGNEAFQRTRAHFVSYCSSNNIPVQGLVLVLVFWIFIEKKSSISLLPDFHWFYVFEMLIAPFFH